MANLGIGIETARPTGESKPANQGMQVNRSEYLVGSGPTKELNSKTLLENGEAVKPMRADISGEVVIGLRDNVRNYMDGLARVVAQNKALLNMPGHEYDKKAWEAIGDDNPQIREKKIEEYITRGNGVKFADILLAQDASRKLQIAGVYFSTNEPGERDDVVNPQTIRRDEGQGAANRLWHNSIRPKLAEIGPDEHLGKFRAVVGALAGTTMAGADIGGRTDGPRGLAIGGVVGLLGGIVGLAGANEGAKTFRSGKTLEVNRSVDALAALQANPQEVEFIKAMHQIDITAFDVDVAHQTLTPRAGKDKQNVNRLVAEAEGEYDLRKMLYEDLGVPPDRLDSMPELNLFETGKLEGFEQTTSIITQKVIDEYYKDGYDPTAHTLAENQDRMFKSRSKVMVKVVEEHIREKEDEENQENSLEMRPIDTLRERLKEYEEDDSVVLARRMKKENEKKEKLNTEQEDRNNRLKKFEASDLALKSLRETAETLALAPYSIALTPNPDSAEVSAKINLKIDSLNKLLEDRSTSTGFEIDLMKAQKDYNLAAGTERQRLSAEAKSGLGPKDTLAQLTKENIEKEAADHAAFLHGSDIKYLTQKIADIEKEIEELRTLEKTFKDTSNDFVEQQHQLLVDAPKELVDTRRSYDTIRRTTHATITDVLLESQTVDQLIVLAEAAPYIIANSTPEEQAALRKMIIQAKSELKARREEIVSPSNPDQVRAITQIALTRGRPISLDDLLDTKSDADLLHILSTTPVYIGFRTSVAARGGDLRTELAYAKAEAARMLRNRYKAGLKEGIEDDEKQVKAIEAKAKDLKPVLNAEKMQLQTSLDIIGRQEPLFIASEQITHDVKARDKVTDLSRYTAADKAILSQSEQDLIDKSKKRIPKGYFEFMDLFFDYRTRSDRNRSEYFSQISTVLPPDKLARLLNQSLGLGVRNNLTDVLTAMNTRIDAGTLDGAHLRTGFIAVTNRLEKEALALN